MGACTGGRAAAHPGPARSAAAAEAATPQPWPPPPGAGAARARVREAALPGQDGTLRHTLRTPSKRVPKLATGVLCRVLCTQAILGILAPDRIFGLTAGVMVLRIRQQVQRPSVRDPNRDMNRDPKGHIYQKQRQTDRRKELSHPLSQDLLSQTWKQT